MNLRYRAYQPAWRRHEQRRDAERIPREPAGPVMPLLCPTGVVECMAERAPALALLRD
jgi:hypothetical protein